MPDDEAPDHEVPDDEAPDHETPDHEAPYENPAGVRRAPDGGTHFWIECPGCIAGSSIGVPHGYAADTVVCPRCRQIVRIREADRLLWRGGAANVNDDAEGRDAGAVRGWAETIAPSITPRLWPAWAEWPRHLAN